MADGHDAAVAEQPFEVAGRPTRDEDPLFVWIRDTGTDDRSLQPEGLRESALEVEVQAHRRLDVHLDHPGRAGSIKHPLHLWAGQAELGSNFTLRTPIDVPPTRQARQQLMLVAIKVDHRGTFVQETEQMLSTAQMLTP
jgi:hypothetical protein